MLKACDKLASIDKKRDDDIKAYENYLKAQEEAKLKASQAKTVTSNDSKLKDLTDKELKDRALKFVSNFDIQMETAAEFIRRGNPADAKIYYRNASDINRKAYLPSYELAKLALMEGNVPSAKKNIEQAIKNNPNSVESLSLAASICYNANEIDKAVEYSEKVLKMAPDNTASRIVLAKVYMGQKEYDKANEEIDKALTMEKTNIMRAELLNFKRQIKQLKGN